MIADCISHPKLAALQRALSIPRYQAVGILESVWLLAAKFADDGNLSKFTPDDIAAFVEWQGQSSDLIAALVACRWLDRVGESLHIHDWDEHCPHYIHDRRRKQEQRASLRENARTSKNQSDRPGHSRTVQERLGKSLPTLPNLTLPNPTSSPLPPSDQEVEVEEVCKQVTAAGVDQSVQAVSMALGRGVSLKAIRDLLKHAKKSKAGPGLVYEWLAGKKQWPDTTAPPKSRGGQETYLRTKKPPSIEDS